MSRSMRMALVLGIVSLWAGPILAQPAVKSAGEEGSLDRLEGRIMRIEEQQKSLSEQIQQVLQNQRLILQELEKIRMRVSKS